MNQHSDSENTLYRKVRDGIMKKKRILAIFLAVVMAMMVPCLRVPLTGRRLLIMLMNGR